MKIEDSFLEYFTTLRIYIVYQFLIEAILGCILVFIYSFFVGIHIGYVFFIFTGFMVFKIFTCRKKCIYDNMIREIDAMYPLGNILYSAYCLIQFPQKNIFYQEIIFQANEKLTQLNPKEIKKKLYSFSFLIYIFLFFIGILLGFSQENIDKTIEVEKNKGIIKASSFKIEKTAEQLKELDITKADKWKEIAKKWRSVETETISPQEIQEDLNFMKNSISPSETSANNSTTAGENTSADIQETTKKWQDEMLQNADSFLQSLQMQLPENIFTKINQQIQENLLAEAAETYIAWQEKKKQVAKQNIQNEINNLIDTLHSKLHLGGNADLPSIEGNSNQGGVSSFTENSLSSQEPVKLSSDAIEIIISSGWTKESLPDQYKKIVQDYMKEKEMYEEK